ncbi:MAG TPA: type II secretion system protein [Verrucomicrobiae bacterium]|nr:type II secretion system protein [Verrucomicrobiae bacterium]
MRPSAFPRTPARAAGGFTLIEIMVVIGVMMLVMAIAMPAMLKAVNKEGMRKAVSDVMEGCSFARDMAILQDHPMDMVIHSADGSINVERAQLPRNQDSITGNGSLSLMDIEEQQAPPPPQRSFSGRLPEDIRVTFLDVNFRDQMKSETARVRFYPNGTSDEFTIVMEGPNGETRKISLEVVTGLPDMQVIREGMH